MNTLAVRKIPRGPLTRPLQVGAVAVEFAFVIVILLLIMAGMVEFGRTFWYADALTKATRDGARMMSTWDSSDIATGVTMAKERVIDAAAEARVSPTSVPVNVTIECDNPPDPISFGACSSSTAPANVRVSITGFTVNLGEWFPFIGNDGLISLGSISIAPHTTMRYMN